MDQAVVPVTRGAARTVRLPAFRRPSWRRVVAGLLVAVVVAGALTVVSTTAHLRIPAPTGLYAVGRATARLVDPGRVERAERGGGPRVVSLVAWYPGVAGTGTAAGYIPDLATIRDGLDASGELGPLVAGLGLVGSNARDGADPARTPGRYPVVLLDPGNATNAAMYASLAEDLASRGYAVIGVDHPYQSMAVDLGDGRVAVYREETVLGDGGASIAAKIDERVADLSLAMDRLAADGGGLAGLDGRLDLDHVAVVGHSNGGLAAVAMCAADARVDACVNLDGSQLGGPFAPTADRAVAPVKPFLFLTKEPSISPASRALFAAASADAFLVQVAGATHDSFTDGARLRPRLLPLDGDPEAVITTERQVVARFLDGYLRSDAPSTFAPFDPPADVRIEVFAGCGDRGAGC